jgi:hypothetical protein
MLQLKNTSGLAATFFLSPDPDGIDALYAVVKGTFILTDGLALADEQLPVALAPKHYGEPAHTSIKSPSDLSLMKPGTDFLLIGHAYAPHGRPTARVDVSIIVGSVRKTVRVYGDRVWQRTTGGFSSSPAEPFEVMPLVWERAFGGCAQREATIYSDTRNPVGTGYRGGAGDEGLDGVRLPNLEDPSTPISSWKQAPAPACFAPLCAHWEPRRSYAGTYDDDWQRSRAPYLPTDFDARFFQLAPADQILKATPTSGELVQVYNASPSGYFSFTMPSLHVQVAYRIRGQRIERPANLDTVVIEPDARRVAMVWRSMLSCDKKALTIEEIEVQALNHG